MSAGARQVVTFALGEHLFAADVQEVERVLPHRPPVAVPHLPAWVSGVREHAGRTLPVVCLRERFGLPPAPAGVEPRVLVFAVGDDRVGVAVDRVLDVTAAPADALDPPPPLFRGLAREYLHGVLRRDGRLVPLLDAARLLSATERLALAEALRDV